MRQTGQSSSGLLLAYLQALGDETDVGFLRESLRVTLQLVMEMEVSAILEASPYERNGQRRAYRNGYRERVWDSPLGEIQLRIPKLRKGTYYPGFIDSLKDAEETLVTLVQDAFMGGVNQRHVEETLRQLGVTASHKSQLFELCQRLDDMVYDFRERPLRKHYSSVWVDVLNLQLPGRSHPYDVAVAVGMQNDGRQEVLGFEVTPYAEGRAFWAEFFDHLAERGLQDVETLISESYSGLKAGLREAMPGTDWQPRREYAGAASNTFVSAVTPQVWVDTSMPGGSKITSSLHNGWSDTIPIWGHIDLPDELDTDFLTRLVGAMLINLQGVWEKYGDLAITG